MATETADLKNITKFGGQNYQIWKFMKGREKKPVAAADNAADVAKWLKKDAKAILFLSAAMEYHQLEYLITCSSSTEMWTKLASIHEHESATNKLTLTTKFHDYRMSPRDSIPQNIARIENLAGQLKDIGQAVTDTMIMAKILSTLPAK